MNVNKRKSKLKLNNFKLRHAPYSLCCMLLKTVKMNYKLLLFLVLSFSLNLKARADDGAYSIGPQGGSIYPINNKYIQMLKEVVIYDEIKGEFSTSFVFYNTSDSVQKVTFGFPVFPAEDSEDVEGDITMSKEKQIYEINKKLQFRTWVDNKKISRKLWAIDTSDDYRFAFVITIYFQPKETKTILNKFKQGYGYGGNNMGTQWKDINYILKSGAGWKGVIKNAKIIFKMNPEDNLTFISNTVVTKKFLPVYDDPNSYKLVNFKNGWTFDPEPTNIDYDKNIITWEFKNLEPDFDIKLTKTKNDFDFICGFDFLDYLDTLSSYIISNDTVNFNKYYDKIRTRKGLFDVKKEYCKMLYEQYGKDFFKDHKFDDFSKYTNRTRHIVNAYAALNNYKFTNKMWYKMFKLFAWYNPQTKNPVYDTIQEKNIDNLKLFEAGKFYVPANAVKKHKEDSRIMNKTNNKDKKFEKKDNNLYAIFFVLIIFILVILGLIIRRNKTKTQ